MLLEKIQSPSDIKNLCLLDMKALAYEIRERLIKVTSATGGHLAPNLGVVELTLAMHYVFNSPKDKFIWDVGHQAYVHKMLTGRNDRFDTLRQFGGISGFPKRKENPHDMFGVGHASTSISAATGFAISKRLNDKEGEIVAVIGDGALSGGMVYEALNHAGHLNLNMTVILNDNDMSIDNSVGSMAKYLTKVRTDPNYAKAKHELETMLKKIPSVGTKVFGVADRFKDRFRNALVPGAFFEELGFKYFGPINGHNLSELISVFRKSKTFDCPVLIHVITTKGKGYLPAENRPDKFHGTGAFDVKTGEQLAKKKAVSYTDVFAKTLISLGEKDEGIVGITAAMASGTGIDKFSKAFPERAFDVGIAEEHAVTMASALALEGLKPFVAIYSTFLQRGFDQIIHDVALQQSPVVFALDRGGLVGEDGPTHHGVFDYSYLRMVPNMTVMAPKDENELQHMLYSATRYACPTSIRYPRGAGKGVSLDSSFEFIQKGRGELLHYGEDILLIAIGSMVYPAMEAANVLEKAGYSVGVINARFVKPLDEALLLKHIRDAKYVFTLEENVIAGGFGSAVNELMTANSIFDKPIRHIGIPDEFITQGSIDILKEQLNLDVEGIVDRVKEEVNRTTAL